MKNTREHKIIPAWRKANNTIQVFFIATVSIKLSFWRNSDCQHQSSLLTCMYEFSFLYVGTNSFLEFAAEVKTTSPYFASIVYILYKYHLIITTDSRLCKRLHFLAVIESASASFTSLLQNDSGLVEGLNTASWDISLLSSYFAVPLSLGISSVLDLPAQPTRFLTRKDKKGL